MIKGKHTVRFSSAKCGFQLDDRFAALARDSLQRFYKQPGHSFGDVSACKKFHRVTVFKSSLSARDLCQISSKFCCLVTAFSNIWMGLHNISPAGKRMAFTDVILQDASGIRRFFTSFYRGDIFSYSSGTGSRPIAESAIQIPNFLCTIRVKGSTEQCHGIQRTFCIRLIDVLLTDMSHLISHAHEFFRPCTVISRQF